MLKACMWRYDHPQQKIVQAVLVLKSKCSRLLLVLCTCWVVVVYASVVSSSQQIKAVKRVG
jgi:uncharacterized membrane protein